MAWPGLPMCTLSGMGTEGRVWACSVQQRQIHRDPAERKSGFPPFHPYQHIQNGRPHASKRRAKAHAAHAPLPHLLSLLVPLSAALLCLRLPPAGCFEEVQLVSCCRRCCCMLQIGRRGRGGGGRASATHTHICCTRPCSSSSADYCHCARWALHLRSGREPRCHPS